ncbi:MAG: DUF4336 domain-containing protein [Oculatellaceae cyanobacterium Prado106]|nr:DUF4336 domain-containing protein [Oculatellaceae cyanobacterium Prado106]
MAASPTPFLPSSPESKQAYRWPFWFTVPLYPYGQRRTLRHEVVPEWVWTFDQLQGIFYVTVPIRMTVVRLEEGGLLVYAPVAPTPECLRLMDELVTQYGAVKYIILPTTSGLEHKAFVGPFARRFAQAVVYVAPGQWSFPLSLPLSWLGFPPGRTQVLPAESSKAPFGSQFDYAVLGPLDLGQGNFGEVAFFHRRSRILLLTDTLVSIPFAPPAIVELDPYPLLFHAREDATEAIADTPENRIKGWHRVALFAFYFRPSAMTTIPLGEAWQAAQQAPDRSRKAYYGLYPFHWQPHWQKSFDALRGEGRLRVAPILQQLILNRAPQQVQDWAKQVALWGFQQIIPCHLDAPVQATPQDFLEAFNCLDPSLPKEAQPWRLPEEDFEFLRELESGLIRRGISQPVDFE